MEAIEKKSDIEMEPKQLALAETFEITEDTLRMIDASMAELKKGNISRRFKTHIFHCGMIKNVL